MINTIRHDIRLRRDLADHIRRLDTVSSYASALAILTAMQQALAARGHTWDDFADFLEQLLEEHLA